MIRNGRDGRLSFTDERGRRAGVAPPEVRLMHPSGVTRHLASGTTITKGTPRRAQRRAGELAQTIMLRGLLHDSVHQRFFFNL